MTEEQPVPTEEVPLLGKMCRDYPGQDFQFIRCHCGLMLLSAPCAECRAPAMRFLLTHQSMVAPRRDGHTPVLAAVLCLLVILWMGLRIDAADGRQVDGQTQLN